MGRIDDYLGYPKLYVASLRLVGAANPSSLIVSKNTLPGGLDWVYTGIGIITGTLEAGVFGVSSSSAGRFSSNVSYNGPGTTEPQFYNLRMATTTTVILNTRDILFALADFSFAANERMIVTIQFWPPS